MIQQIEKLTNALNNVNANLHGRNITDIDIEEIITFDQVWSDSSCGCGRAGGQTITSSPTVVVELCDGRYEIYFNGRFAYEIRKPTDLFFSHLEWHALKGKKKGYDLEEGEDNDKQ